MATPFVSEIRMFGFNFAPKGWATCDGQLLPISQNAALFSLLGTTYGGNGTSTFGLPDLRGRTPTNFGSGQGLSPVTLGEVYGTENVILNTSEMPSHTHVPQGSTANDAALAPSGNVSGVQPDGYLPFAPTGGSPMNPAALSIAGSSQGHSNMQPYLVVNFCIALQGIFPSRN